MTNEKLKERALQVAKARNIKKVFATEDGNVFVPNAKGEASNDAMNHARQSRKKLQEFEFSEAEIKGEAPAKKKSEKAESAGTTEVTEAIVEAVEESQPVVESEAPAKKAAKPAAKGKSGKK